MTDTETMSDTDQEQYREALSDDIFACAQLVIQGVVPFVPTVEQGRYPFGEYAKLDPTEHVELDDLDEATEQWAAGLGLDIDTFLGSLPDTRTAYGRWLARKAHREFFVKYWTDRLALIRLDPTRLDDAENALRQLISHCEQLAVFLEDPTEEGA